MVCSSGCVSCVQENETNSNYTAGAGASAVIVPKESEIRNRVSQDSRRFSLRGKKRPFLEKWRSARVSLSPLLLAGFACLTILSVPSFAQTNPLNFGDAPGQWGARQDGTARLEQAFAASREAAYGIVATRVSMDANRCRKHNVMPTD